MITAVVLRSTQLSRSRHSSIPYVTGGRLCVFSSSFKCLRSHDLQHNAIQHRILSYLYGTVVLFPFVLILHWLHFVAFHHCVVPVIVRTYTDSIGKFPAGSL